MIQLGQFVIFSTQKIYILPFSADYFTEQLQNVTKPYGEKPHRKKDLANYRFTGKITPDSFRLMRVIAEPNNFLFIAEGNIERSSRGCIIFTQFKMFAFTKFLIFFFTLLGAGATLFFVLQEQNWFYAMLACVFTCLHTLVCVVNMQRQRRLIQTTLEEFIDSLCLVL